MIKLQSKDQFTKVAYLELLTGEVQVMDEQRSPHSKISEIQGTFSEVEGHMLYLYRTGEALYFRIDNQTIELTEETEIHLIRGNSQVSRLSVLRKGAKLLSFTYMVPNPNPPLSIDPTPFIGEEDYDFPLFVYNIVRNPVKKATVYR